MSDVCFACLAWLYELFTNAYSGCSRPTLNFIEHFDLGCSILTVKLLMSTSLAWTWTWRRFAFFVLSLAWNVSRLLVPQPKPQEEMTDISGYLILYCLIILCIFLCDTSSVWLLFWNSLFLLSDFVVIIICSLGTMKIEDSVERMTLDLFLNCGVSEEVSVTFDPEMDLFCWLISLWAILFCS